MKENQDQIDDEFSDQTEFVSLEGKEVLPEEDEVDQLADAITAESQEETTEVYIRADGKKVRRVKKSSASVGPNDEVEIITRPDGTKVPQKGDAAKGDGAKGEGAKDADAKKASDANKGSGSSNGLLSTYRPPRATSRCSTGCWNATRRFSPISSYSMCRLPSPLQLPDCVIVAPIF